MIKIITSEEIKNDIISESRYLHDTLTEDIDYDKINTLMHLYLLPDEAWVIDSKKK